MDSYGDKITMGCLGKIAHYRLQTSLSQCACPGLCVYKHLSMKESIELVQTNFSMC